MLFNLVDECAAHMSAFAAKTIDQKSAMTKYAHRHLHIWCGEKRAAPKMNDYIRI